MKISRPKSNQVKRAERLVSAYEAGCLMAGRLSSRLDDSKSREVARQQGYQERDEINCFVAALRNHL